jgi:hypothetical protein
MVVEWLGEHLLSEALRTGSIWEGFSSIEAVNLKAIDEETILPYCAQ